MYEPGLPPCGAYVCHTQAPRFLRVLGRRPGAEHLSLARAARAAARLGSLLVGWMDGIRGECRSSVWLTNCKLVVKLVVKQLQRRSPVRPDWLLSLLPSPSPQDIVPVIGLLDDLIIVPGGY